MQTFLVIITGEALFQGSYSWVHGVKKSIDTLIIYVHVNTK